MNKAYEAAARALSVADDEPTFLLRAQDRCAPATVRDWAQRARNLGASEEKARGAMDIALEMEKWQQTHAAKVPD
jgi:hypothetical protein